MATCESYFTWNLNSGEENAKQRDTIVTYGAAFGEAAPPQHETGREETSH
jgi:hypothetical protein